MIARIPSKTVAIFGGSNSASKLGWVHYLSSSNPDVEVLNYSLGAVPSVYALYYLRHVIDIELECVVVEYTLNDGQLFRDGHLSLDLIKSTLISLIKISFEKRIKLIFLLLSELGTCKAVTDGSEPVHTLYKLVCNLYNIPFVCFTEYVSVNLITEYEQLYFERDPYHYNQRASIIISKLVANKINALTVFNSLPFPLTTLSFTVLHKYNSFGIKGESHVLEVNNSLVSRDFLVLPPGSSAHTAVQGRLIGILTNSTPLSGWIAITYGRHKILKNIYDYFTRSRGLRTDLIFFKPFVGVYNSEQKCTLSIENASADIEAKDFVVDSTPHDHHPEIEFGQTSFCFHSLLVSLTLYLICLIPKVFLNP